MTDMDTFADDFDDDACMVCGATDPAECDEDAHLNAYEAGMALAEQDRERRAYWAGH